MMLLGFVLGFSCSKDSTLTGGYQHHKIDSLLHPMLFDTGSRWIYQEQFTGTSDTILLQHIEEDTLGPYAAGNGHTASEQVLRLFFSSTETGEYFEEYIADLISQGNVAGGYVYLACRQIGLVSRNARIADIHDSLVINGVVYRQVVEMEIADDNFIKKNMNRYYVDSVGLVMKEVLFNNTIKEVWALSGYAVKLRAP